jgi:hypothetical protein
MFRTQLSAEEKEREKGRKDGNLNFRGYTKPWKIN